MELSAPIATWCRQYLAVPTLTWCLFCTCGVSSSGQDEKHLFKWKQIKVKEHIMSQCNPQLSGQETLNFSLWAVWESGNSLARKFPRIPCPGLLCSSAALVKLALSRRNLVFYFLLQFTFWLFLQLWREYRRWTCWSHQWDFQSQSESCKSVPE